MIVLTRLGAVAAGRLRRALKPTDLMVPAATWGAVEAVLNRDHVDLAVIDPCLADPGASVRGQPPAFREVTARPYAIPLVAYTQACPLAVQTLAVARWRPVAVVLIDIDDDGDRLAGVIAAAPRAAVPERILAVLRPRLRALPPAMASALEDLFRRPEAFSHVEGLARRAGLTRRSLDRWLLRAGLASAHVVLACARVARAYTVLCCTGRRIDAAIRVLGDRSSARLRRDVEIVTGGTVGMLRCTEPEPLVADIACCVLGGRIGRHRFPDRGVVSPLLAASDLAE